MLSEVFWIKSRIPKFRKVLRKVYFCLNPNKKSLNMHLTLKIMILNKFGRPMKLLMRNVLKAINVLKIK